MGWVVQVMREPPDLDDAPSSAYFRVAIADPKKAVQAVAKHTAADQNHDSECHRAVVRGCSGARLKGGASEPSMSTSRTCASVLPLT